MSEVLSQNEIDALLNALSTGEVDVNEIEEHSKEKKIKDYDFRNPQKIAKDQLRTLEVIHENFGRLLQTFLSGYLRAPVKISILSVDQYAYSEFSNAISNPAFLSIIDFEPLQGEIIIDISSKIAFAIIDRLLGGDGKKVDEIRSFTEIELTLLRKLINKINNLLSDAWKNVVDLKPSLGRIETNPQFAQIVSPSETIALITLNISIGDVKGMLNICLPYIVIESILDKLNTKYWFTSTKTKQNKDNVKILEQRIKKALVLMKAELATTTLTLKDITELQVGDVIRIDDFNGNDVKIKIGSNLIFYGESGAIGKKMAVKVTQVKRDGDDADD